MRTSEMGRKQLGGRRDGKRWDDNKMPLIARVDGGNRDHRVEKGSRSGTKHTHEGSPSLSRPVPDPTTFAGPDHYRAYPWRKGKPISATTRIPLVAVPSSRLTLDPEGNGESNLKSNTPTHPTAVSTQHL